MSEPAPQPEPLSAAEARARREAIHRGLAQANTAALLVIAIVVALAAAAAVAAFRAESSAREALQNEQRAREALWDASLAQARAQRLTHEMGQRVKSLEAIRVAARLRPSPELREEAISALALPDFEPEPQSYSESIRAVAVAVDHDLRHYAAADGQGKISVGRFSDGQTLAAFSFPAPGGPCLALSPQGDLLAVKLGEQLKVWSVTEARLLWETNRARAPGFDPGPRFDAAGGLIAYASGEDAVSICDARTGEVKHRAGPLPNPGAMAFHPLTNVIAVSCGHETRLWDYAAGKLARALPARNGDFLHLSWSADGRLLAGGCDDRAAYVWDMESGVEKACRGHLREGVRGVLRPQGDLLVTLAWDRILRVWDPASGRQLFQAEGDAPLGFSADGSRLAVFSMSSGIRLWRVHPPAECRLFTAPSGGRSFWNSQFSPDSRRVFGAADDELWMWDLERGGRPAQGGQGRADSILFPDKNVMLTTGGDSALRWEIPEGLPVKLPQPASLFRIKDHEISSAVLLPDQRRLVMNINGTGYLYDPATNKLRRLLGDHPGLDRLALSPDGKWIASGCWINTYAPDTSTRVWAAENGKLELNFNSPNSHVAFSPDNRWFLAAFAEEYQLRETGSWKIARTFSCDAPGLVPSAMAFAPDGTLALKASERTIRLVEPESGRELARFSSPDGHSISSLRFSPDGKKLAATTESHLQVWDLPRLRERLRDLHLDWEDSGSKAAPETSSSFQGWISSSGGPLAALIALGVGLAVAFALAQRRYHRRLLAGYMETDRLMARRNEELRAAQAELAHSQKMRALGTLAAGIAHDFNNLLSVIRMSSKLIGRAAPEHPEIRENVGEIETAVQQGKAVAHSMLGYSRKDDERSGPVSLTEAVEDSVGLLSKQFLSGLALKLELDEDAPPVTGSQGQVEQILLNLVVNAAEAMQSRGELRITVRRHARLPGRFILPPRRIGFLVELQVADTGPGIPPEILPRIFDAFFTTKSMSAAQGTGLGLATVYTIAEQAGYGIAVDTAPGQGTTFRIFFPAADEALPPAAPASPQSS